MIIDTSAIVAIVLGEPDAPKYADSMASGRSSGLYISAANYMECCIVVDAKAEKSENPALVRHFLDKVFRDFDIQIVPVTKEIVDIARQAFRDFSKVIAKHPAKLNYGDCFSYALAVKTGQPLLWKGDDFTHTGIESALDR